MFWRPVKYLYHPLYSPCPWGDSFQNLLKYCWKFSSFISYVMPCKSEYDQLQQKLSTTAFIYGVFLLVPRGLKCSIHLNTRSYHMSTWAVRGVVTTAIKPWSKTPVHFCFSYGAVKMPLHGGWTCSMTSLHTHRSRAILHVGQGSISQEYQTWTSAHLFDIW